MGHGGVVAHSCPLAGVFTQVVRSLHAAFRSRSLRFVFPTSSSLVLVLRRTREERSTDVGSTFAAVNFLHFFIGRNVVLTVSASV